MSAANEGLPLEGPINPRPKRRGPDVLMLCFHEIEHSGDLGDATEFCFEAGAKKIRVETTDYEGAETALIKVTTPDAERFIVALDDTDMKDLYDVVWRTK